MPIIKRKNIPVQSIAAPDGGPIQPPGTVSVESIIKYCDQKATDAIWDECDAEKAQRYQDLADEHRRKLNAGVVYAPPVA